MDWIDALDEHGYNVFIDELVWHLREGRFPTRLTKKVSPEPGVEYSFENHDPSFLRETEFLESNWAEAVELIGTFPQLAAVHLVSA